MIQISLRDISISFSDSALVENANLFIERGEKISLIGRNGAGKSTLLKLIQGKIIPDSGNVENAKGLKIALLPQAVPAEMPGTIESIVNSYLADTNNDYQNNVIVAKILSKLQLEGSLLFNHLSGGMKRLVLLAGILVQEPDVLLLDEPTNHLDIDKISLLENLLLSFRNTVIFVTHDRILLQKLATQIVEIDNGKLLHWKGKYDKYLEHRKNMSEAEERANALFDKKLAQEEQWIRQGIKARRTRNEGRVRALKKMREERQQRRTRQGLVKLGAGKVELSDKIVLEIDNITFGYQQQPIVKHFSQLLLRGDKVGIIGPNGVGKSTLINLMLGKLQPQAGEIKQGTNLQIGYFDQLRSQLDDEKTVLDSLSELGDTIQVDNQQKHVMSYLQDYLFSPARSRTQIKYLSGGERNRVLLAKLFAKPCNVLVMDEPTNDLDMETLELLEEKLINFQGTLLLISHDRAFLNNVVTSTIVFEGNGHLEEYIGGYDEWLAHKADPSNHKIKTTLKQKSSPKESDKLSYKEKKELDELPAKIEALEKDIDTLQSTLADPQFYKKEPESISRLQQELIELEEQLSSCFARWEQLDRKANIS